MSKKEATQKIRKVQKQNDKNILDIDKLSKHSPKIKAPFRIAKSIFF